MVVITAVPEPDAVNDKSPEAVNAPKVDAPPSVRVIVMSLAITLPVSTVPWPENAAVMSP